MSEKKSQFFGQKGTGSAIMEKDARIISTIEMYAQLETFCKHSGLNPTQVAVNTWGYPYIPIPEVKKAYGNVRLAPKNVTPAFLGHPIYWIEPELTERREKESRQEWCIRMFYLIDAFGYWDEYLRWINFLEIVGFDFSDAQIKTYHKIADQHAVTDTYKLLDEDDLDFPLEEVQEHYSQALTKCAEIYDEESVKLLHNQVREYKFARQILGDDIREWDSTFDSPKGVWAEKFYPQLSEIASEYTRRSREGDTVVSDLMKRANKVFDVLATVIEKMHHASSILELPAKAIADGNPGGAARISYMAAAMSLASSRDNLKKESLDRIGQEIRNSFTSGNLGEGGFDGVVESMSEEYSLAWNRLRLAFVNYQNIQRGQEVYATIMELNSAMTDGGTPQGGMVASDDEFDVMAEWEEGLK